MLFHLAVIATLVAVTAAMRPMSACTLGRITFYGSQLNGGGSCNFGGMTGSTGPGYLYGIAPNEALYNTASQCGVCYEIVGPRGAVRAMVVDYCPSGGWCSGSMPHLDLTQETFPLVADPNLGVTNVTWRVVSCDVSGNIKMRIKTGSSATWLSLLMFNHRVGLTSVQISTDGTKGAKWASTTRKMYNEWEWSSSTALTVPFLVKVTGVTGVSVLATIPAITGGNIVTANSQFPEVAVGYGGSSSGCCSSPSNAAIIFDDSLSSLWADWSWSSTRNFAYTGEYKTGSKSIQVVYQANGGLQIGNSVGMQTADYTGITFWIKGKTSGSKVYFKLDGNTQQTITLTTSWVQYTYKWATLGVGTSFRVFALQSDASAPTVYIDEIKFTSTSTSSSTGVCATGVLTGTTLTSSSTTCSLKTSKRAMKREVEVDEKNLRATTGLTLTGVNLASAEFGESNLPGTFGTHYTYPTTSEVDYFKGKGMNVLRIPFRWERLQQSASSSLDSTELGRLKTIVSYATGKSMKVILDPHNYARYYGSIIGASGSSVTAAVFADFWSRVATEFMSNSNVIFGLMNEPYGLDATVWFADAQAAINAIRSAGATNLILAPGVSWTGAHSWTSTWYGTSNGDGWNLVDSGNNLMVDVHQYVDSGYSGSTESCPDSTTGSKILVSFTTWAKAKGVKAFLSEFGSGVSTTCATVINDLLSYMEANKDVWYGWTWWAAGPWWGEYILTLEPTSSGQDRGQMAYLTSHMASSSSTGQSEWTSTEQTSLVTLHNNARSSVSPAAKTMPSLVWDSTLASQAQTYASKCSAALNTARKYSSSGYVGESIYTTSLSSATPSAVLSTWLAEKSGYTLESNKCSLTSCSEYLQVIWAATTKFGCGVKYCSSGISGTSLTSGTVVVCDYYTGGNIAGEKPYTVSSTCTSATCKSLNKTCGSWSDGCGNTLSCGSCSGSTCSSGICQCSRSTCSSLSKSCGNWSDGCSGTISCGTCLSGQTCSSTGVCSSTTCTPSKTCGEQDCGTIYDGCKTVSCGACASNEYCSGGTTCTALDLLSQWSQYAPDSLTSSNWALSGNDLVLTNFTLTNKERRIIFSGAPSSWFSDSYSTLSVKVAATEGIVGVGMRLGQGTGRTKDGLAWKLQISSSDSTADASFCQTFKGKEYCKSAVTGVSFSKTATNNFTINYATSGSYINMLAWLNGNTLISGTSPWTVAKSNYSNIGNAFFVTKGSASKTFRQVTISSKTYVHVKLSSCVSASAWSSFCSCLLGISSSSVTARGLGTDASCNSSKRATDMYSELLTELTDDSATSVSSSGLASNAIQTFADGSATSVGLTVSSSSVILPELASGLVVAPEASAAALSTGAIVGIAVGASVGGVALVGAAVGGVLYVVNKASKEDKPAESTPEGGSRRKSLVMLFSKKREGINVMDPNPGDVHSSITARAPPVQS